MLIMIYVFFFNLLMVFLLQHLLPIEMNCSPHKLALSSIPPSTCYIRPIFVSTKSAAKREEIGNAAITFGDLGRIIHREDGGWKGLFEFDTTRALLLISSLLLSADTQRGPFDLIIR